MEGVGAFLHCCSSNLCAKAGRHQEDLVMSRRTKELWHRNANRLADTKYGNT
jgi:hypothetical protein